MKILYLDQYYGIIEEILEVGYSKFFVSIFKCKWIDNNNDVKSDESRMRLVHFWKIGYRDKLSWHIEHPKFFMLKILY